MALEAPLLSQLSPELQGRIEGRLSIEAGDGTVAGTVDAEATDLLVRGFGPWSATATARLDGRDLQLEQLEAVGYGGTLAARGRLRLGAGRSELMVRGRGLELAELILPISGTMAPLATRADADTY